MADFYPLYRKTAFFPKKLLFSILLTVCLQFLFAQSPITSSSFVPQSPISTGASPYSIVSGDLDGDGKPDLVVSVGGFPYAASVYRNTSSIGTISFAPKVDLVTGVVPFGLALGDLNGDGKPDIVVTNSGVGSYTISVFINNSTPGNISFAAGVQYPTGGNPISVTINDLNGDGRPDIVTANYASNTISVFENISTGGVLSLKPKADFATGAFPTSVKITDLDKDGRPDVIIANNGSNTFSVLQNNTAFGNDLISFLTKFDINTNNSPQSVTVSDVDADGKTDVIVTNAASGNVSVYQNTSSSGTISFSPKSDFATAGGPVSLCSGDLNKDGKEDLAVATGDSISLVINSSSSGNISFYPPVVFPSGSTTHDITIADLDGDGKPDLASVNEASNSISLFLNKTDVPLITGFAPQAAGKGVTIQIHGSNFSTASQVWFGGIPASSFVVVSDNLIQAIVDTGSSGNISILNLRGTGSIAGFQFFNPAVINSFSPTTGGPGTTVMIEGKQLTGTTAVLFGGIQALSYTVVSDSLIRATVGSGSSGTVTIITPAKSVALAGFNFSRNIPVINSFSPASGIVGSTVTISGRNFSSIPTNNVVYFGTVKATVITATTTTLHVVVPAGATYQPLSVTTSSLTAYSTEPFHTSFGIGGSFPNGSFTSGTDASGIVPPINIRSADLDGDGKQDLLEVNQQGNTLLVFRNTTIGGVVSFGPRMDLPTGQGPNEVAVGDLDGDGLLDLVVVNISDNTVSVFKNVSTPGTISFQSKIDYAVSQVPRGVAIGDIDGDGRPDIVVANSYSYVSTVSILRNMSSLSTLLFDNPVDYSTGNGPVTVALSDIDGDGKTDIVTGNFNANSISVLRNLSSPGMISLDGKKDYATGTNPQIITIGDLDGDGRPDIVSINPESQNLTVLSNQSSNGNISIAGRQDLNLGNYSFDITMGDLDGDGKPDLLVGDPAVDSVLVFRNTSISGNIMFAPVTGFKTVNQPQSIWIADFDGDGRNDIAAGNYNLISILTNQEPVAAKPLIQSFTPLSAGTGDTVQITGKNFTGTQSVYFGGVSAQSFVLVSDSVIRAYIGNGTSGSVSVLTVGGSDSLQGFLFTGPILSGFTPDSAGPGMTVHISGRQFTGATAVQFGAVASNSFTVINDSMIVATPGAGSSGNLSVVTLNGTGTMPGFVYLDTLPAPVIYSFTPDSASNGVLCRINGLHFSKITDIRFGGVSASSFTILSDSLITAIVGPGASGYVYVANHTGADSLSGFTYFVFPPPPPVIYSFTPGSGWMGDTITIHGIHFNGTTYVGFAGYIAASYIVVSDSVILAVLNGGSQGSVFVTTPAGTASLAGFLYQKNLPAPSIQSFVPQSGGSGTVVSIYGIHFSGVYNVSFGGVQAASYVFINDSTIQATIGNGSSGDVMIAAAGGSAILDGFTYISAADSPFQFNLFTGSSSGNNINLNWQTSHEQSILQFIIERSNDSVSFQPIDSLPAKHLLSDYTDYVYTDAHPLTGMNYYRINAMDSTGNFILSNLIGLNSSTATNKSIKLSPNPAQSYFYVQHPLSALPSQVQILNIMGKLVKTVNVEPNTQIIKINVADLDRGTYVISWTDGGKVIASILEIR